VLQTWCWKDMQHVTQSANSAAQQREHCLSKHTRTYKIDADSHLYNCISGALCFKIEIVKNTPAKSLRRRVFECNCSADFALWCRSKLQGISVRLFAQKTQQRCQLFIPIELLLKYNTWVVFCSDNCNDNIWG